MTAQTELEILFNVASHFAVQLERWEENFLFTAPRPEGCTTRKLGRYVRRLWAHPREEEVIDALEQLEERRADYACLMPWRDLGIVNFRWGRYREAIDAWLQMPAHELQDFKLRLALGEAFKQESRHAEAEEVAWQAVIQKPASPEAWGLLAAIRSHNHDHEGAARLSQTALSFKPKDIPMQLAHAFALEREGKAEDSRAALSAVTQAAPRNSKSWLAVGEFHMSQNRYDQAVPALEKAVLFGRRNAAHWNIYGLALLRSGQMLKAEEAFTRALKIKSDQPAYLANLAYSQEQSGKYVEAYDSVCRQRFAAEELTIAYLKKKVGQAPLGMRTPKPVVISATIDLKLTVGGQIKICEFNNLWPSGFEGFRRLTGLDMHENIVRPYLGRLSRELSLHIVCPEQRHPDYTTYIKAHRPGAEGSTRVLPNTDLGFEAFCSYKDYTAYATPHSAASYFPATSVVPLSGSEAETESQISATFGNDPERLIVLKPANSCIGNGVEILRLGDVAGRLAALRENYAATDLPAQEADYWHANFHPNAVIQDYIPSLPVTAADGLDYNGTMRVAFTATLDKEKKSLTHLEFHGCWWKLPAKDCSNGPAALDPEAMISLSPSKLIPGTDPAFDPPIAAAVSAEHRALVESQLQNCLADLLPKVSASPDQFAGKVLRSLHSNTPSKRALATRLITDDLFGNYLYVMKDEHYWQAATAAMDRNFGDNAPAADKIYKEFLTQPAEAIKMRRHYCAVATAARWIAPPAAQKAEPPPSLGKSLLKELLFPRY